MTRITKRKPGRGWWCSAATGPHKGTEREIALAVTPYNVELRLKGCRGVLRFPIAKLFILAAMAEAADLAKARAEQKARARAERAGKAFKPRRISVRRSSIRI